MQNAAAIAEFEQKTPAARSVGAEMVASRETQEVHVAMAAAKRFPGDVVDGTVQHYSGREKQNAP